MAEADPLRSRTTVTEHRASTIASRSTLYHEALTVIEEQYGRQLTLDEIAAQIASSRRQLQRAFAEIGDTTFRDALTGVRMERAADLLREPRFSVRSVAYQVGYRQPAQFAKAFRRHHGVSPSEFRVARRFANHDFARTHSLAA
jgi:AraC family transcriptional regulator of adaptative response / methylphosphotriester-DNA alkyltransferase methyltransferase